MEQRCKIFLLTSKSVLGFMVGVVGSFLNFFNDPIWVAIFE